MKIPSEHGWHLFINALASCVSAVACIAALYCLWHHDWDPATAFFAWAILMQMYVKD